MSEQENPTTREDWSLMIITNNGTVSLIRNLSLGKVVQIYDSLIPDRGSGIYHIQGRDVEKREIFGPAGWDGCKKSMKHSFELKKAVCDGGPNAGKGYLSGICSLCGEHKFIWIDEVPDSPVSTNNP